MATYRGKYHLVGLVTARGPGWSKCGLAQRGGKAEFVPSPADCDCRLCLRSWKSEQRKQTEIYGDLNSYKKSDFWEALDGR